MVAADEISGRDARQGGAERGGGEDLAVAARLQNVAGEGDQLRPLRAHGGEQAGVALPEARAVQIRELHQAEAVKGRGQGGVAQLVARDAEGAARGQGGRREGGQGQRPGQRAAARHCASTSRTYMVRTLGSLVSRTCSSKRGRFLSMLESLPKP